MKKLLLLGIFIASQIFAAFETITTYYDKDFTRPGYIFKDKATVYVAARVDNQKGGFREGLVRSLFPPIIPWPPELNSVPNIIPTIFLDFDEDGTYTAEFKIAKEGGENELVVFHGAGAVIEVNIDGVDVGQGAISADYDPPGITKLDISDRIFSPYTSIGVEDTTTITLRCPEDGTYILSMEGKELNRGTIAKNQDMSFVWDGKYWDEDTGYWEEFTEGLHILYASVFDIAGNESKGSKTITIDSTDPFFTFLSAYPPFFSPGTSTGSKDETMISFCSSEEGRYEISIDGLTPTGVYSGDLSGYWGFYTWDGSYATGTAEEGEHTIKVTIIDRAGNYKSKDIIVTIDRTPPLITSLTDNTGGDCFYLNEVIQFTLKARDWREGKEVDADYGGAIANINGKDISLAYLGEGLGTEGSIYQGYYTVSAGDFGTWTISGSFTDKAGNWAINNGTNTGTISLDGSRERPVKIGRILRMVVLYPKETRPSLANLLVIGSTTESISIKWEGEDFTEGQRVKVVDEEKKHIWIGIFTNAEVSLNNGLLYYGEPISDYRNVKIGTSYALKKGLKGGDELILSLEGGKIEKELLFSPPTMGSTSLTIQNIEINIGDLILVSDNVSTWMSTATNNGSFTISNLNLYSGPIVPDYSKLSGLLARKVTRATGGDCMIDIGEVRPNIPLSDDGVDGIGILSGDIISGDGVYSGVYTIREGDDTENAQVFGHFFYNRKRAENDPYTDNRLKITIDATPPNITNNNIFPIPFNPYLNYGKYGKNAAIMFNLSEKSFIVVTIKNSKNEIVRILKSPEAQFGENVTIFWDGKTSAGSIPPDGHYSYTIEAEDIAGNKAVPKTGEIILTTIEIKVKDLNISPNPFWPDKDIPETIDVVIGFNVVLENSRGGKVTDEQLNNMWFNLSSHDEVPFGLLKLEVYDEKGNQIKMPGYPDLSAGYDTDPWPSGWPTGYDAFSCSNYCIGDSRIDKGDGNVSNDYNILVPFRRDSNGSYSSYFNYGWLDWDDAKGQYIVRVGAELVSIWWEALHKPEDPEEKWHAVPCYGHYGLKAEDIDGKVLAEPPTPPVEPDTFKPIIIATQPSDQDVILQGAISVVWAKLIDIPTSGGSGIDFEKSEIFLADSFDRKIGGTQTNDGIDTIFWSLDNPLDNGKPGSYTIKIRPVDRNRNGVSDDYQRFTFQIKDVTKPDVFGPNPTGIVISPFEGPVYCFVSDVALGDSGIDMQKTTISMKKGQATITLTQDYSPTGNNSGKLIGELVSPLLDNGAYDGTYTVFVKAYDGAGNCNSYQWSFYLKTIFPKLFDPWPTGIVYTPYTGTISVGISELDEYASGINWTESTISLLDPLGCEVLMNKTYTIGTSTNIGRLIGEPGTLTLAGKYTIIATGYDNVGHVKVGTYTFDLRKIAPIIENPWPSFAVRAPYLGTISVDIRVEAGKPGIDTSTLILSLSKGSEVVTLTTKYIGGTQSGTIIGTPTFSLLEGEYTIFAFATDSATNLTSYTSNFSVVWETPTIETLAISPSLFSPYTSFGVFDKATVSFTSDCDGTYSIFVDGRLLSGTATGFLKRGSITLHLWDGKDTYGLPFSDGSHTLVVSVTNQGGKIGTRSAIITIDSIPPGISDIAVSNPIFSPIPPDSIKDTTDISFSLLTEDGSFTLSIGGIKMQERFLTKNATFTYNWNGFPIDGSYTVEVIAIDTVGNIETKTIIVIIDNTKPIIESITDNTGGRIFFRDEVISFTLKGSPDIERADCILEDNTISLLKIKEDLWQGSYIVKLGDKGTWTVKGVIIDFAGNPGTNNNTTIFGIVTVNGEMPNPIKASRIMRIGFIPQEEQRPPLSGLLIVGSTTNTLSIKWQEENLQNGQSVKVEDGNHIWVIKIEEKIGTLSNAQLYYGLPVSDYTKVAPQEARLLKSLLKAGDKLIVSLDAARVEKDITPIIATKTLTSLTITGLITEGKFILVSDDIHTWLSPATQNGTFTISNQNLYSGPLISDYITLSNLIVKEVTWATGGNAAADLGVIAQGIQLVDNGVASFFDKMPGDGVYSGFYSMKENDNGRDVPIFGHFIYNNYNALNDPYTDERMTIDIDGTKPVIKNQNVEPNPFNPYIKNLSIKYHLSEDARVQINILNKGGDIIKSIVSPNPKSGENISDFWDGRDNNASIVSDGIYYYTIDAKDLAGNSANQVNGEIKVTSVEIRIENLIFSPNPFYSDDIPESSDVLIKFRAVLKSSAGGAVTDLQLDNLGFDFVQYSNHLNIPYALLNFETYDENGKEIEHTGYPDMTGGNDIDPWLFSLRDGQWVWGVPPNYKNPNTNKDYVASLGYPTKPDKGDGDTENDNGTLIPFLKDDNGNYYCDYEYGELDWKNPPGNYTVRIWAELVSIAWKLTSEEDAEEETWHAKPRYHGHYKLRSDVLDGIMRCVADLGVITQDKFPPVVISSTPFSGEKKDPGSVLFIEVKLGDGNGVGVHPINSSIYLEDALGGNIPGNLTNNGIDTIYWTLTNSLTAPGNYTIRISAVDFNNNIASYSVTFSIVDSITPIISDPYPTGIVEAPFYGPITVNISEIGRGESGINGGSSTISLKKGGLDIPLTNEYTEGINPNKGILKGNLTSPLTQPGTYTFYVTAYDKTNNNTITTFYFSIAQGIYNEIDPPEISHTPPSIAFVNEKIPITATIIDEGIGLASATLYYYPVGSQTIEGLSMEFKGSDTFACDIPGQPNTGVLTYWISATDKNGNVGSITYRINVLPKETTIYTQPNPAKGFTKFRVVLKQNANVKIELYAITGELVWEYKGNLEAKENFIDYNCINKNGNKLGTGLYIYKVTIEYPTRKETTIKKMVIIKQ